LIHKESVTMAEHVADAAAGLMSPLQHARVAPRDTGPGTVVAAELPHLGYIVLRGRAGDAAFTDGVASVLGMPLPLEPCTLARSGRAIALWQSPDEWWLVCARAERDALLVALTQALQGVFSQVVDNSGGFTALHLQGADAMTVLRHVSPHDFDSLARHQCVATVAGKAGFTVVRTDCGVTLVFRRSFATYLWQLVERAASPYGLDLVSAAQAPDGLFSALLGPVRITAATPQDNAMSA